MQKLDSKVKAVKFFNIVGKYALYARVDKEKQIARKFKTKVWVRCVWSMTFHAMLNMFPEQVYVRSTWIRSCKR